MRRARGANLLRKPGDQRRRAHEGPYRRNRHVLEIHRRRCRDRHGDRGAQLGLTGHGLTSSNSSVSRPSSHSASASSHWSRRPTAAHLGEVAARVDDVMRDAINPILRERVAGAGKGAFASTGRERKSRHFGAFGRVAEWFKAAVLKTARGSRPSWVRIPPLPPIFRPPSLIQPWGWSNLLENFEGTPVGAIPETPAGKLAHA